MRLINTKTLELEEFMIEDGLRYAILSHRWASEEVSYADMRNLKKARTMKGFVKIKSFCDYAASQGFEYGWVDTCCIDKSSSAELSEAINSMYRWYGQAAVCYAYLSDVTHEHKAIEFVLSLWFKRGWTLQELLAPFKVIFFDKDWIELGNKRELNSEISLATRIQQRAIDFPLAVHTFSVAERMSWASDRITTRPEDMAYCLLGIFKVNIPLLYGEGERAFIRLQEQIMKDHADRSLFKWNPPLDAEGIGPLATSPACFKDVEGLELDRRYHQPTRLDHSYSLTNRGLLIEVRLWPAGLTTIPLFIASICVWQKYDFCILLQKVDHTEPGQYIRVNPHPDVPLLNNEEENLVKLAANRKLLTRPSFTKTVYITSENSVPWDAFWKLRSNSFSLQELAKVEGNAGLMAVELNYLGQWRAEPKELDYNKGQIGTLGTIKLAAKGLDGAVNPSKIPSTMLLGFDLESRPVCIVATEAGKEDPEPERRFHVETQSDLPFDISTTALEDITCFETEGWSDIRNPDSSTSTIMEVRERQGLWAFKCPHHKKEVRHRLGNTGWSLIMKVLDSVPGWGTIWTVLLDRTERVKVIPPRPDMDWIVPPEP